MRTHKSKGITSVIIILMMGIVAGLLIYYGTTKFTTQKIDGKCIADSMDTLDRIQKVISKINTGHAASMPITLGKCIDALVFSNKEDLFTVFKTANINTDEIFHCPKEYKGIIVAVPFPEGGKGGAFDAISDGLKKKDLKKLLNWGTSAAGLNLKSNCKNLPDENYTFANPETFRGSKDGEKKYCLKISKTADNSFSVDQPKEIQKDDECETTIIPLPLV